MEKRNKARLNVKKWFEAYAEEDTPEDLACQRIVAPCWQSASFYRLN
jgi:hypothetical protein